MNRLFAIFVVIIFFFHTDHHLSSWYRWRNEIGYQCMYRRSTHIIVLRYIYISLHSTISPFFCLQRAAIIKDVSRTHDTTHQSTHARLINIGSMWQMTENICRRYCRVSSQRLLCMGQELRVPHARYSCYDTSWSLSTPTWFLLFE